MSMEVRGLNRLVIPAQHPHRNPARGYGWQGGPPPQQQQAPRWAHDRLQGAAWERSRRLDYSGKRRSKATVRHGHRRLERLDYTRLTSSIRVLREDS